MVWLVYLDHGRTGGLMWKFATISAFFMIVKPASIRFNSCHGFQPPMNHALVKWITISEPLPIRKQWPNHLGCEWMAYTISMVHYLFVHGVDLLYYLGSYMLRPKTWNLWSGSWVSSWTWTAYYLWFNYFLASRGANATRLPSLYWGVQVKSQWKIHTVVEITFWKPLWNGIPWGCRTMLFERFPVCHNAGKIYLQGVKIGL